MLSMKDKPYILCVDSNWYEIIILRGSGDRPCMVAKNPYIFNKKDYLEDNILVNNVESLILHVMSVLT